MFNRSARLIARRQTREKGDMTTLIENRDRRIARIVRR